VSAARSVRGVAFVGALVLAAGARGDAVGYAGVVDLHEEGATLRVEHHHDWSRATEAPRLKMITGAKDPFTAANTYAWLRVSEREGGRELFRSPAPALTFLWISPDERWIVGLSHLKLWNPVQVVVFDRDGRRRLARGLEGVDWPGVMESETNAIDWYKAPKPAMALVEHPDGTAVLKVEDRLGVMREFAIPALP
jgi:hypothetical protein